MQPGDAVRTWKARGRMTAGQLAHLERLRPAYALDLDAPFDRLDVFGRDAPLVLEIGCGMGEATAEMAAADASRDILALDVHLPGITALLRRIEERGLTNVRVGHGDGLVVLRELLPAGSLDEVRVFFPDPWPKSRHAKRRLVTLPFVDLVADRLRLGGRLHVATDWPAYAEQVLDVLARSADLEVAGRDRGSRPVTRFEARGHAAGRPSTDIVAVRR